ncbi:hypothetical protein AB0E62_00190 [Streptomyces sp. NPDC038707]|uniref:hypothetical protein n=1 Tax=Streptomyces sp. NPDC038707 TaxID=3154329 RepID=UPI0034087A92
MPRPTRAQRAAELEKLYAFVDAHPTNPPHRQELNASPDWKQALDAALQQITNSTDDDEAMAIVLPHVEAAFKRGCEAGSSRAGYRLVKENERLRRGMRRLREVVEDFGDTGTIRALHAALDNFMDDKEDSCTATAAGRTPASNTAAADEPPTPTAP